MRDNYRRMRDNYRSMHTSIWCCAHRTSTSSLSLAVRYRYLDSFNPILKTSKAYMIDWVCQGAFCVAVATDSLSSRNIFGLVVMKDCMRNNNAKDIHT